MIRSHFTALSSFTPLLEARFHAFIFIDKDVETIHLPSSSRSLATSFDPLRHPLTPATPPAPPKKNTGLRGICFSLSSQPSVHRVQPHFFAPFARTTGANTTRARDNHGAQEGFQEPTGQIGGPADLRISAVAKRVMFLSSTERLFRFALEFWSTKSVLEASF